MSLSANQARHELQRMISAGCFADRQALHMHIAQRGLQLNRSGTDYVTVVVADGDRARIYLPSQLHLGLDRVSRRRDGSQTYLVGVKPDAISVFTVYLLVAVAPNQQTAAYVGSTSFLRRRLGEHCNGRDEASADLSQWAKRHQASIFVREIMCTNNKGGAFQLEGCLTERLIDDGWLLPGVSRWGAARRCASMMTRSFKSSRISWSMPVVADIVTWTPLRHFKFYG